MSYETIKVGIKKCLPPLIERKVFVLIGYARVSSLDQSLDLQRDALKVACCERIFEDKVSGAKDSRPGLGAALDHLRPGDTLVGVVLRSLSPSAKSRYEVPNMFLELELRSFFLYFIA